LATVIDTAASRAGIDPASLNHRHLTSAMTGLNLALLELSMEDISSFWKIDNESTTIAATASTLALASGTIDVVDVTISSDAGVTDVPLNRAPREDGFYVASKTTTGQPSFYWVNYESLSPVLNFWPVSDGAYTIKYNRLRHSQDAGALSETPDVQKFWTDALTYNLATRLSEEFNVARIARNEARYHEMVEKAKGARVGRGPIIISARGFGRARTRRL
jgi:hypothetical protein